MAKHECNPSRYLSVLRLKYVSVLQTTAGLLARVARRVRTRTGRVEGAAAERAAQPTLDAPEHGQTVGPREQAASDLALNADTDLEPIADKKREP